MINFIKDELKKNGDKVSIVSVECLQNLKQDIDNLKNNTSLNPFTRDVLDYYMFQLPKTDFDIRSIITIASPSPFVKVNVIYHSKIISLTLPPTYMDMVSRPVTLEKQLNTLLNPRGFHALYTDSLPQKLMAVRSGLGSYGRNNICYVDGMGSFHKITTFYSDIPCEKFVWHEIRRTDFCSSCKICIKKCPTNAITNEDYLIKSDRCITHFNEHPGERFPEWISPSSHNCIVGCIECQYSCPNNRNYLSNVIEPVSFTEEETLLLLEENSIHTYPAALTEKIKTLGLYEYINILPRNLRALLNK